jgi:hypothetical protein
MANGKIERHWVKPIDRPDIQLPNGEIARPTARVARDSGVADRTERRRGYPTIKYGGVTYTLLNARARQIAASATKQKHRGPKRKAPATTGAAVTRGDDSDEKASTQR